jgi:hypothetical protein
MERDNKLPTREQGYNKQFKLSTFIMIAQSTELKNVNQNIDMDQKML